MTNDCFLGYLKDHFFPFVKCISGITFPVLLLVDGVSSHISLDVAGIKLVRLASIPYLITITRESEFCRETRIILYALLPNTTHILQPADVAIFGPLKKKWFRGTRQWLIENKEPVSMHNVAKVT